MAEYEHFLGGLDQIGTDWILVQELLLPPRSVDQTRADAKERSKAYWDRGQSRGNEVGTALIFSSLSSTRYQISLINATSTKYQVTKYMQFEIARATSIGNESREQQ